MSRLVLDEVDEGPPPSLLGLSTSLSDVTFIFRLNQTLRWGLRRVGDLDCIQAPIRSGHALFRNAQGAQEQAVFWNFPDHSAWLKGEAPASNDLFSETLSEAPKRPLVQKPKNIHAVLIMDPPLSPGEMVILQRQIASIPEVLGQQVLPWSSLRVRENFLLEPLKI
ncbi:MAG: hypothetical protein P8N56_04355 [Schleiferiaceae bacterium]|nr:hypothetical protein [Schleiferiaceae bacterium]